MPDKHYSAIHTPIVDIFSNSIIHNSSLSYYSMFDIFLLYSLAVLLFALDFLVLIHAQIIPSVAFRLSSTLHFSHSPPVAFELYFPSCITLTNGRYSVWIDIRMQLSTIFEQKIRRVTHSATDDSVVLLIISDRLKRNKPRMTSLRKDWSTCFGSVHYGLE